MREADATYVFLRQLLLPSAQVSVLLGVIDDGVAVPRDNELSDLELGVRDRAARDARIGRAVQPAVEDVFAPVRGRDKHFRHPSAVRSLLPRLERR